MTTESDPTSHKKTPPSGVALGGILGMLAWFNQPANLLDVTGALEWLVMVAFVGFCMALGALVGRLLGKKNEVQDRTTVNQELK